MLFPHMITIYHLDTSTGDDKYTKIVLDGWYWQGEQTLQKDGKGVLTTKPTTIISNCEKARKYGKEYEIHENDRVILGVGEEITSFKELHNSITVKSVSVNVVGSDVDHIKITGV